jgi:hypothetical protein
MFAWIRTLTTAGNRLAKSLRALADTVDEVIDLRLQAGRPHRSGFIAGSRPAAR